MPTSEPMARPDSEMVTPPTTKAMEPAALVAMPRLSTRIRAATRTLRVLEKSTWLSTRLRTPTAEIMPYSTRLTPPTTEAGMAPMSAANLGLKLNTMAKQAARRTTRGSYTLVSASTPVFSP